MESLPVYHDIAKFADFQWKNPDISRTKRLLHVIHIIFRSDLGKV